MNSEKKKRAIPLLIFILHSDPQYDIHDAGLSACVLLTY